MIKHQFSCEHYIKSFILIILFVLGNNCVSASGQNTPELATFQYVSLETIAPESAKSFLDEIIDGTISHIINTPTLFITAEPRELAKAKVIIELIDQSQKFVVKTVAPASVADRFADCQQLSSQLDNITIGNFSNPPSGPMANKAIIDVHDNNVIVIAPENIADMIVNTISGLTEAQQTNDYVNQLNNTHTRTNNSLATFERLPQTQTTDIDGLTTPGQIFAQQADDIITPQQMASELFLQAQPVSSRAETEIVPIPNGDDVVSLTLPNKISLIEFLRLTGNYLRFDFMYDESVLAEAGEITFNPNGDLRGQVTIRDLYHLLESALKFKGFVMTRGWGNLVTIVPEANALSIDPVLIDPDNPQLMAGDVVVQSVFELNNIDTASAQNFLRNMSLALNIEPITQTQTLIVTAYAHRMQRIRDLLNLVDRPGKPRQFRFRTLQHTEAQSLAPRLQTLAEQLGTISITIAATTTEVEIPPQPRQNPGESAAAFNARLTAWNAQRTRALATQRAAAASATQPGETSVTPTVFVDADERTNRILMIGTQEQLQEVEKLINTLDVVQQELRKLESYKIEHIDAEEVKLKLQELGIISDGSTSTTTSSRLTGDIQQPASDTSAARTRPPATAATTGTTDALASDVLVGEPQVVVIESTNSLLINATDEQHERIASIISHVDSQIDEEEIPYQMYKLKNQNPENVASVLERLVLEIIADEEGKIQSVEYNQPDRITIVPDPNTSSIIVYANKKHQDWIGNLIEKLDKRRPQVLIDVTLVQISKNDAFNYDLNIISSIPDLTNTSGLTSAILPGIEGANLVAPLLDSGRNYYADMQANGGVGTGFYGDRHINALLTAMQQKDYGRVLAKPKLLVNDNEEGMIETKDTTYVTTQTGTIIEGVNNAVQTAITYDPYYAGITLTITPHISESDLRLDVNLTRSDFGTITGEKPPDITNSTVDTTVTIPDGSTIILGGLQKLNQSKGGKKVPLLGDIPLIGGAFRTINNSDIQSNLYVFVKAEIIRATEGDETELALISEENRAVFEEHENEFQKYQSMPGFDDAPMKPFKVLDAR